MNAENVIPYGEFVHEVALKGGPEAYKEAVRIAKEKAVALVKEASFHDGKQFGRKQMIPWLIVTGTAAAALGINEGIRFLKGKKNERIELETKAKEAEEYLISESEEVTADVEEEDMDNGK